MNEQMSNATLSWRIFDDVTYKKIETNQITDFSTKFRDQGGSNATSTQSFVAMAPFGGPIVSVYKRPGTSLNDVKYTIIIQNLPKHSFKFKEFDRGVIIFVDWTVNEDLLLVTEDGKYHIIDIFHYDTSNDKSITLGESISTITSACVFKTNQGTGLVALRKNQEGFVAVKNIYIPAIQTIPIDVVSTVSAWCVIDPTDITILYAYDNNLSTISAGTSRREQQAVPGLADTITKLVTSSNYKSIAILKENGDVLVGLRENIGQAQSLVLKYSSHNDKTKITDITWCGSDAVIGIRTSSKNLFDLLIINGASLQPMTEASRQAITSDTLYYTSPVWLSTEIDGIRIISGRTLDFFQRVPNELFIVTDMLSDSPGAKLYSAYLNFKYENQMAEELLSQLKSNRSTNGLEDAVKQCLAAASNENDSMMQKILLKSAHFGRSLLNASNEKASAKRSNMSVTNELFTHVIRHLRIVNDLQHMNQSIPITYKQFEFIGIATLIDRLLRRNLHEFATRVTKLLRIPADEGENRILVKWAVQELVNPSNTNEQMIADTIKNRLANIPGIPFINIIREAYKLKKYFVVERLLDVIKVSLSDQIDMLLLLNKKDEALQRAISCGDTDLALFVLIRIKKSESLPDFMLRLQRMKSLPLKLQLECLERLERNKLHTDLLKRNPDERERIAYSHIIQRYASALTIPDQKSELTSANKLFRDIKTDSVAQLIDEEIRLITRQDELEKKLFNIQLNGLSLVDTLEVLLLNYDKDADALRKEFNINDKRYWWIKIQAYAKKNAWTELLEFGKRPSSPIGYEPFIDVCIRSKRLDEARRFAERTIYSSKLDDDRLPYMYAKVQMTDEAINSAIKLKSLDALNFIESKCQLNEANSTKLRQAKEKLQESDINPLTNVLRIFNRGS